MQRRPSVLVVEDEMIVALAIEALLSERQHDVLLAPGVAAARTLAESAARLDFAIVDLQLADGAGAALIETLRETWPGLPVIVSTGYALAAKEQAIVSAAEKLTMVIHKPWEERELMAAVDWAARLAAPEPA